MKGKCWKCGEMNEVVENGYCFCTKCKIWYDPIKQEKKNQRIIGDEDIV